MLRQRLISTPLCFSKLEYDRKIRQRETCHIGKPPAGRYLRSSCTEEFPRIHHRRSTYPDAGDCGKRRRLRRAKCRFIAPARCNRPAELISGSPQAVDDRKAADYVVSGL